MAGDASARERVELAAWVDHLIPADADPSATGAGFFEFLAHNASDVDRAALRAALTSLANAADRAFARPFSALVPRERDAVLDALERDGDARAHARFVASLAAQSYYGDPQNGGNRDGVSWRAIGFDPKPKRAYEATRDAIEATDPANVRSAYDAIVVGAGAGGGIVACALAEAGFEVLLVERGDWLPFAQIGRDHLRNHRFPRYGHNTGPDLDGHPRVLADGDSERVLRAHEPGYNNNAMTVGGGTRVYGAQAWRFAPEDFRMASIYGVPEGSALADWPIDYPTLAPFYAEAERKIGVCGSAGHAREGAREVYPMPPLPETRDARLLRAAADRLGWRVGPVPLAINSRVFNGRAACAGCGECVGFACVSNSKNGTHNTVLPRALATRRCALVTRAQALRVVTDDRGMARGIDVAFDRERGAVRELAARVVVIAAGAIETARLLLASRSRAHPAGIGNQHDQVGRCLQGHVYAGATGIAREDVQDSIGPGPSIATCEFNHGNPGVIGGGMIANEFVPLPIHYWESFYPPSLPRRGVEGKRAFANAYRRRLVVMGPIQEIPMADARVTLDPRVRDKFGCAVARLSGTLHPESVAAAQFMRGKSEAWLAAAGAEALTSFAPRSTRMLSAGQHQAGTCRMGRDPRASVCDADGRVHGQAHLYVADASLHPTNGGYNPVLTVMANAYRISAAIVADLKVP